MIELKQFFQNQNKNTPYLIIGKGPSFSNIKQEQSSCSEFSYKGNSINLNNYKTITLNHTVDKINNPWLASIIDINVLDQITNIEKAQYLLMPYYPHLPLNVDPSPPYIPIEEYFKKYKILKKFNDENRLICYDLSDAIGYRTNFVIDIGIFSGDTIFNLLSCQGFNNISSIGLDGGNNYSEEFQYLNNISLLKNKQESFDSSLVNISKTELKYNIKLKRL